ncbi:MAG TPA: hypothetical protein VK536_05335 [Candidatus Limnocylindrales bacterium]|nr:hypothetical protein [Candidatus Limnocylindrales bacterium]
MAAAILPCAWNCSPREIGGLACPLRDGEVLANYYVINRERTLACGNCSGQKPHPELLTSLKSSINKEAKTGKRG